MKLLGWMHRKFRQVGSEPLKDFVIGNPCNCLSGQRSVDDEQHFQSPNYGAKPGRHAQRETRLRTPFAGSEAMREEFENCQGVTLADESELFHGFLTIGTLGSGTALADPSTPTFATSVDYITEKETEVTENELRLINDELEKVLMAEAKDDCCNDSSGRSSRISTGRSSQGSTITLSGRPMPEGQETTEHKNTVCPLQGYLFGSAIEMSETTAAAAKKEHRTSLGELFQRSKLTEEGCELKFEKEDRHTAMHAMKKKLKKKMFLGSRSSSPTTSASVDSTSADTKLQKILQMFHRKVHPESSAATKKTEKEKQKSKKKANWGDKEYNGDQDHHGKDVLIAQPSRRASQKETIQSLKVPPKTPQFTLAGSESNGNRECWIRTDADYLVLEL